MGLAQRGEGPSLGRCNMRKSISKTIVAGLTALSISAATVSLPATSASAGWGRGNRHGGGGMGGWHGGGGCGGRWHGGGWNGGWRGGGLDGGWRGGGWGWRGAGWSGGWRGGWAGGLRLGLGRLRRLVGPGIRHWRRSRRCRLLPLLGRLLWLPELWVRRLRRLSEASPDLQSQRTLPWPTLGERLLEGVVQRRRCAVRHGDGDFSGNRFSARGGRSPPRIAERSRNIVDE